MVEDIKVEVEECQDEVGHNSNILLLAEGTMVEEDDSDKGVKDTMEAEAGVIGVSNRRCKDRHHKHRNSKNHSL